MNACAMLDDVEPDIAGDRSDEPTDAMLLAAVGAGDHNGPLRELYRRYAGRIYGVGLQLLSNPGLAEELVQETFLRVWRNADRYDAARGSPASFIFTIARRLAIDLWRRPSSRPTEPEPPDAPTDDHVDRLILKLGVREALETLSEAHRQVLELSYRDQLKQAEIAERLGIPVGTVKTRSHHALRNLKVALERREIHG